MADAKPVNLLVVYNGKFAQVMKLLDKLVATEAIKIKFPGWKILFTETTSLGFAFNYAEKVREFAQIFPLLSACVTKEDYGKLADTALKAFPGIAQFVELDWDKADDNEVGEFVDNVCMLVDILLPVLP